MEGDGYNEIEDDKNGQGDDDKDFRLLRAVRLGREQVLWASQDQEATVQHVGQQRPDVVLDLVCRAGRAEAARCRGLPVDTGAGSITS